MTSTSESEAKFGFRGINEKAIGVVSELQCGVCAKMFSSEKTLQIHRIIHTNLKPHQCDICHKSFRFNSNLSEHRTLHTGFTPYGCPYCGKACRLKGNLKKHMRLHMTSKEELDAAWSLFHGKSDLPKKSTASDSALLKEYSSILPASLLDDLEPEFPEEPTSSKISRLQPPQLSVDDEIRLLERKMESVCTVAELLDVAKPMASEVYTCPICHASFNTRDGCLDHLDVEHENSEWRMGFYCETCLRLFHDNSDHDLHIFYHQLVSDLTNSSDS